MHCTALVLRRKVRRRALRAARASRRARRRAALLRDAEPAAGAERDHVRQVPAAGGGQPEAHVRRQGPHGERRYAYLYGTYALALVLVLLCLRLLVTLAVQLVSAAVRAGPVMARFVLNKMGFACGEEIVVQGQACTRTLLLLLL